MLSFSRLLQLSLATTLVYIVVGYVPGLSPLLAPRFVEWMPPVMGLQLVLTIGCAIESLRRGQGGALAPRGWLTPDVKLGLGVAAALTAVIVLAIPAEFRVLADETNLISTSLGIFRTARADNITMAQTYFNMFHVTAAEWAARPLLFPSLMALLHWVLGYDAYHGMTVNVGCIFVTLFVLVLIGGFLKDRVMGVIAAALLAGMPVFQLYGRASGFEPVNLAALSLLMLAMLAMARKPTLLRFEMTVWMGLLAAQGRYESIVMMLPVALLGLVSLPQLKEDSGSWRLAMAPLVMIPLRWQRIETSVINAGDKITDPFGLQFLWPHFKNALVFFFDPTPGTYPVCQMTSVFAVLGGLSVVWAMLQRRRESGLPPETKAIALYLAGIFVIFLTHIAYYMGDFKAPIIGRYALSYMVPFCLAAAIPLAQAWERFDFRLWICVLVGGIFCYGVTTTTVNDYGRQLLLYREYRANLDALQAYPKESTLVITDRPGMYAAHMYGAVSFDWLKGVGNLDSVVHNIERHLYSNVIIIQQVHYGETTPKPPVSDRFRTRILKEYQNSADYWVRISIVTGTEPERGPPITLSRFWHPV